MLVHVVKPGDTLWKIAMQYQTTATNIQSLNGLSSETIVPGLALVINSPQPYSLKQYVVISGDSWWSIANQFGIPVQQLLNINSTPGPYGLVAGQTILIPNPVYNKTTIETNGYLVVTGSPQDVALVRQYAAVLTYVSVFAYSFDPAGNLQNPKGAPLAPVPGIKYLMVVANLVSGGQFSIELAHQMLNNATARQSLINNMIQELWQRGWAGVNLDIEHILPSDRYQYNSFVEQAVTALKPLGFLVTVAVPPKPFDNPTNEWVGGFDYQALGAAADRVMLMTYDWGFPQGRPEAVAPVDKIRAVLDYALSLMESQKVLLGMPLYGDDWPLPQNPNNPATITVNQSAMTNAIVHGATIQIDPVAVAPYYYYWAMGRNRVVWYNDALSILAKAQLVIEYQLRGFFYWALGYDSPQNWILLQDAFWHQSS